MIKDIENVRRLYAPSADSLRKSLPDIGASLDTACCELAADCTIEGVDQLAMRFKAGEQMLQHLRRALMAEQCGDV